MIRIHLKEDWSGPREIGTPSPPYRKDGESSAQGVKSETEKLGAELRLTSGSPKDKEYIRKVAQGVDVPKDLSIDVMSDSGKIESGPAAGYLVGQYDPVMKIINIFPAFFTQKPELARAVFTHEVNHHKFSRVRKANIEGNEPVQGIMKPWFSQLRGIADEYEYGGAGVTKYSQRYWDVYYVDKTPAKLWAAVDETLAEVGALKSLGKPIPNPKWENMYNDVNKAYDLIRGT